MNEEKWRAEDSMKWLNLAAISATGTAMMRFTVQTHTSNSIAVGILFAILTLVAIYGGWKADKHE